MRPCTREVSRLKLSSERHNTVLCLILGSESLGTRDHILLSQISDFPFGRLLRLAGSRWRYSIPPPHGLKSIPNPILSYITSARTTHRKHSPSTVVWRRPHRKHLSCVRLRVHWSITITRRGADDIENAASSIVACWTTFTGLLLGNALIKSVTTFSPYEACLAAKGPHVEPLP
jgi:hypothetical protein